jgi:primosomal protein N' (replication factor Y)
MVAVPVPVRKLFCYRVPSTLSDQLAVGVRVRVPFGHRQLVGTVVDYPAGPPAPDLTIKAIDGVVDDRRIITADILALTRFVSDYYLCSWGETIEAALPPDPGPVRMERHIRRLPQADSTALSTRATLQQALMKALPQDGALVPVSRLDTTLRRAIAPLEKLGVIEVLEKRRVDSTAAHRADGQAPVKPPTPTVGQAAVWKQLSPALGARAFSAFLLFGVTGSGKTEVYFRAAEDVLRRGRGVIYLVPEIGLTPLLLDKIADRFPSQAVVLHSGLSKAERFSAWDSLRTGRRRFVVGTRSAIFAPLPDPGLIIVDEEQDGSYKQSDMPRYNGRDLALVRARSAGAVVLLGSATPSMESFQHARTGRYTLLRLGGRIGARPLPEVTFVDMREEYRNQNEVRPVSQRLIDELQHCVQQGKQALVLRNRRGWASALFCPTCGERITCTHCSISMTWHRAVRRLRCHYCGLETSRPDECPHCRSAELTMLGEGTEQIEDLIREAVPGARVARMDRDTIRRRDAHARMLREFDVGEIDILVGTQMIAKGHDFPRVTLVGILSADHALGLPDFRAGERTFQLLTQVAGRAGRGESPGLVIAQAFEPEHPLLRQAAKQDYEAFFDHELRYRQALKFPPMTALAQIIVLDRHQHQAREWADEIGMALREESQGSLMLAGPGPAPVERAKGLYRYQLLVRTAGRRRLVDMVDGALKRIEGQVPLRAIHVDVDPYSLM